MTNAWPKAYYLDLERRRASPGTDVMLPTEDHEAEGKMIVTSDKESTYQRAGQHMEQRAESKPADLWL